MGRPEDLIVSYLRAGSLVIPTKTRETVLPTQEVVDVGLESMNLVFQAARWLNGERAALSGAIVDNSEFFDSLLAAAQILSPKDNDKIREVEVRVASKKPDHGTAPEKASVILSSDIKIRATAERQVIARRRARSRRIVLRGRVYSVTQKDSETRGGEMKIAVEVAPDDFAPKNPTLLYDQPLLRTITRAFESGDIYEVRVQQQEINGKWSTKATDLTVLSLTHVEEKKDDAKPEV